MRSGRQRLAHVVHGVRVRRGRALGDQRPDGEGIGGFAGTTPPRVAITADDAVNRLDRGRGLDTSAPLTSRQLPIALTWLVHV